MRSTLFLLVMYQFVLITQALAWQEISNNSIPEKLNLNINSSAFESHPVISPDGTTLYFRRSNHPENEGGIKGGSDIWFSKGDSASNWFLAKKVGFPLNNKGNNQICSILPDGQTILLSGLYNSDGQPSNSPGISIARKTSTGWDIPEKVEIEYYQNKSEQGDFFLSSNGKILIMSIEYFYSYGNEDIHVSFLKENGAWTQPLNLGPQINTKYHEITPYLSPDGVTLYFSSNGHKGFGSKDIFVTKRLDDTWQKWSKPQNLGENINTAGMETSFVIPASGKYAYFSSSKNSDSHGEIYQVQIPEKVRPEPVILVSGKVLDAKTKKPLQSVINYEILSEGKNIGKASSDPSTGEYKIVLPGGKENYGYFAESKGYLSLNESFDASDVSDYVEIKKDLYLIPLEIGEAITLKNVFFEKSTPNILKESYPELDRMVKILNDNPSMEIEIRGHTDNLGKAELNIQLSEKRVETVRNYFISKGINENRVKGKGYGGSHPIAPNDSEENKKLNRRVEFIVLKK